MDVGIYGPLTGYIASAVAVAVGFSLSHRAISGAPAVVARFGREPLTIRLLHALLAHFDPALPSFRYIAPHPVLIAGWIGLFITSLNLIPAGQLDGGHILYALSPGLHRAVTRVLPFALFLAGVFYWAGWILWGVILLIPAMRHPKVPAMFALSRSRKILGALGIAILLLTFTPTPFYDNSLLQILR
jgi:membrane-associated protease RseP (regulator of RpoE activity)